MDHDTGIIHWSTLFIYLFLLNIVHLLCLGIIYWSTWIMIRRMKGRLCSLMWINIGALSSKGIDQLTNAQITGLKFSSLDDGGEFYNMYAKLVRFSIRKDEIKRNKNNIVTSRRWVCAKEGLRIRKN